MKKLLCTLVAAFILTVAPAAWAQDPGAGLYLPGDITLELAQVAINAGIAKAKEQGTLMDIAIVDAGGNLKAFVRMDGAFLASVDISIKKAKTARSLNMSTSTLHDASVPGQELYGIEVTNDGMVIFGGGELIKDKNGMIIGAIGVSGSSVANDMAVAQAGAAAVLATFK
ncbi:MAG: heme-binding protein [Deltaproteobacteria bacterium]|nr:heme-binding protein [Deltaproteobacteria bacterium]